MIGRKKQELKYDKTSVKFIIVRQNPCHTAQTFVIRTFMFCASLICFTKRLTSYLQFNWKGKDKFSLRMPNTASKLSIQYVIQYLPIKVHQRPGKSLETYSFIFFLRTSCKTFSSNAILPLLIFQTIFLVFTENALQSGPNYTLNLFNLMKRSFKQIIYRMTNSYPSIIRPFFF